MRVIVGSVVLIYSHIVFADGNLKQQHESEVLSIQQREITTREQIAQEQTRIESLKQELQSVNNELVNASNEKFTLLGIDEQGLKNSESELAGIKQHLEAFSTIDPSEILKNKVLLDELKLQIEKYKSSRISRLSAFSSQVQSCELLLQKIISKITIEQQAAIQNQNSALNVSEPVLSQSAVQTQVNTVALADSWVVKFKDTGRESLYKIAGYPEVYGNSDKWLLLYKANKDLIDQNFQKYTRSRSNSTELSPQDILFPGQILKIPR